MKPYIWVRVDNRLIHGQIIQAWLPFLNPSVIITVEGDQLPNGIQSTLMRMAVPKHIDLIFLTSEQLKKSWSIFIHNKNDKTVLVLVKEVKIIYEAVIKGDFLPDIINLGNIHALDGRIEITPYIFLSKEEYNMLKEINSKGIKIQLQTLPTQSPLYFEEIKL